MSTQLDIFYNTTSLAGPELKQREMRAGTQNRLILDIFKSLPDNSFTPFEILLMLPWEKFNTPITSIRRSITTLTNLGYLVKTAERRAGIYGDMNFTWRLK
jgi:Fe2+ or Zn2+ uptake regulation protein